MSTSKTHRLTPPKCAVFTVVDMHLEWRKPTDPAAAELAATQQRELDAQNPDDHVAYPLRDDIEFVIAVDDGRPVACGALQRLDAKTAEIKRMYVVPDRRGAGLSRAILTALEDRARTQGCVYARLETALMFTAAVGLYRAAGYTEIEPYGEYIGDPLSYCMEKFLAG
jgi:putative acetyltransferase